MGLPGESPARSVAHAVERSEIANVSVTSYKMGRLKRDS